MKPRRKWTLADGIAELERELDQRGRTYPQFIGRGALDPETAAEQQWALAGTLTFLEWCRRHEVQLRQALGHAKGTTA